MPYLILTFVTVISTFILWVKVGMMSIYKHYDGPLYIIVAKTFYNPEKIRDLKLEINLNEKYFAAHLPGYPLLIRVVKEARIIGGYLRSMVFVNLLFTIFLAWFFYYFIKVFKISRLPLIHVIVFLFLPRFLVVRSVGAPESLFILLILLSLYFFEKEKYLLAGIFGGLATITKTPGILLFFAYFLVLAEKFLQSFEHRERKMQLIKDYLHYFWILLIPLALLAVFAFYWRQYQDFFAYFNSGDNIHLVYPFSVFDFKKSWVGTAWLEDVLFYYFIYGLAVVNLKNTKYRSFFYFSLIFFLAIIFVQHRDISRYSLPLWPMAIISFKNFFSSKEFLIVSLILLPAIYFYALNFLQYNIMPISDWSAFF